MTFIGHIYFAPFGFDTGLALSMLTFYVFSRQLSGAFQWRTFLLSALFFVCTLGSKGPIGAILLCALGIPCLFWLLKDRDLKKSLLFGASLLVLFAFVYIVFLSGSGAQTLSVGTEDSSQLSIIQIPKISDRYHMISSWKLPGLLKEIIFMVYYCWQCHTPLFYMFTAAIIFKTIFVRKYSVIDASCLFAGFCGVICTRIFSHFGYSQMYFMMAAYPYILLFTCIAWEQALDKLQGTKLPMRRMLQGLLTITFGIGLLMISNNNIYQNAFISQEERGYGNCFDNGCLKLKGQDFGINYSNTYVTTEDYAAYEWIRRNTDPMSLCVNSRKAITTYSRPPLAEGIFTERHMYIENVALIKQCMQNNAAAIKDLHDNGVSYIIQAKSLFPDFYCPGGSIVYDGESVAVYDIRVLQ